MSCVGANFLDNCCFCRLQEKQEEVRELKSLSETDRHRIFALQKELDDTRAEVKQRSSAIEQLRVELSSLEVGKVELRQSHEQVRDMKDMLHREQVEKTQLMSRIEVLTDSLEACKRSNRELEADNKDLDSEIQRLREEHNGARKTVDAHAELSRENERLRLSSTSLRDEVRELSALVNSLQSDNKHCKELSVKANNEIEKLKAALEASDAHGEVCNNNLIADQNHK